MIFGMFASRRATQSIIIFLEHHAPELSHSITITCFSGPEIGPALNRNTAGRKNATHNSWVRVCFVFFCEGGGLLHCYRDLLHRQQKDLKWQTAALSPGWDQSGWMWEQQGGFVLFIAPSSAEKSAVTTPLLFGGGPQYRVQILGVYSVPLVQSVRLGLDMQERLVPACSEHI